MYRIQVAGAGYLGARIAGFFRAQNQKVSVLIRDPSRNEDFARKGILPYAVDLTRPETLKLVPPADFNIISVAPDESTEKAYEDIYLKGVRNYLNHLSAQPRKPRLIVYISSTAVWKDGQGESVNEDTPAEPHHRKSEILLEAEKQILESGFPAIILRLSGIYGPGRNRLKPLLAKTWPSDTHDRYMNMIHADDVAPMLPVLFNGADLGQVYIVSDDEPVKRSDFLAWLCPKIGAEIPPVDSGHVTGKQIRNQKLKSMGIQLKYPTFREGYEMILRNSKE